MATINRFLTDALIDTRKNFRTVAYACPRAMRGKGIIEFEHQTIDGVLSYHDYPFTKYNLGRLIKASKTVRHNKTFDWLMFFD